MEKQTAVKFLIEKVNRHFTPEEVIYYQDVYKQALEMEEQQQEISDEEIWKMAKFFSDDSIHNYWFNEGAKSYREQLKQRK